MQAKAQTYNHKTEACGFEKTERRVATRPQQKILTE